jgi:hypothetical protein
LFVLRSYRDKKVVGVVRFSLRTSSGYLSDVGNTDEMAQNALKNFLKDEVFCKI